MTAVVVDASVTLAWFFEDERDATSLAMLEHVRRNRAVVPALWIWESANTLLQAQRRSRISAETSASIVEELRALPITVEPVGPEPRLGTEMGLANRFSLTAYDAAYLELALRRGLRLGTKDARMATAADALGLLWAPTP